MGVIERIRSLTAAQRDALRAIDDEERIAIEIEELEAEHLAAEEAYLRRRDRLLGREIPASYPDVEAARALLHRVAAERQRRLERMRMAVLAGPPRPAGGPSQLDLLPPHA
jgi:Spy/CpxP family protein refolding chaperone